MVPQSDKAALWLKYMKKTSLLLLSIWLLFSENLLAEVVFLSNGSVFHLHSATSLFKVIALLRLLSRINLSVSHDNDSSLAWRYYVSGWKKKEKAQAQNNNGTLFFPKASKAVALICLLLQPDLISVTEFLIDGHVYISIAKLAVIWWNIRFRPQGE